jgi:hypothetical protein
VNFLTTVPAEKLRRLLGQMRELLTPGGRIIANFPVKYSDDEPLPSERDVPTLFQTLPSLKKGVGSMVTRRTTRTIVATPSGAAPIVLVVRASQILPDWFWDRALA